MRLNARSYQYVSLFFVDIMLIATFMLLLVMMRGVEIELLVNIGIYKNVENMTDKEMF
jgi:hypothetical protein